MILDSWGVLEGLGERVVHMHAHPCPTAAFQDQEGNRCSMFVIKTDERRCVVDPHTTEG